MIGAIFGDIAGSAYEFHSTKNPDFRMITRKSRPTDDSYMTIAVADALMRTASSNDDDAIRAALISSMKSIGREHSNAGYGGRFYEWLHSDQTEPYNSYGNGSAMRVSPAGWMFDTLEDTLHAAKLTAEVTHNHPEGIKGALAIASAIYLARNNCTKDNIKKYIEDSFGYDLGRRAADIRRWYTFDVTCQGSVPEAIIAFLDSGSYEGAVRTAVSLGGDADTQGCMAGAIAEAYYGGIPQAMKDYALEKLDDRCRGITEEFCRKYVQTRG